MQQYLHVTVKVIFSLILVLPIVGLTGLLGEPVRELYHTDQAFAFIQMLEDIKYIDVMLVVVHAIAVIALWTKREALAALLALPISLNVVGFHLVLDGGLFTGGAVLGNLMLISNVYLLLKNRKVLKPLLQPAVSH